MSHAAAPRCRRPVRWTLLTVLVLCSCGAPGASDAGLDCSVGITTCPSEGTGCRQQLADDSCWGQCTCRSGRWSCQRECPADEPCRQGGYCANPPRSCSTPADAGCAVDCECRQTIPGFFASCLKRCGGTQGQCFDAGTVDAGAFTCSAP